MILSVTVIVGKLKKRTKMKKLKPSSGLRINAYDVIMQAVEEGAFYGVRRAYKHTDTPSQDAIADAVRQAVVNALCEVLVFEDE